MMFTIVNSRYDIQIIIRWWKQQKLRDNKYKRNIKMILNGNPLESTKSFSGVGK